MITITEALRRNPQVTDYKIEIVAKESYELFFVKGKLETVRCTDTCDKEVTVYVDHDGFKGNSQFFVYPSTTEEQLDELISQAVAKALVISNPHYELPAAEVGEYAVESNFSMYTPVELASKVAEAVFAPTVEGASLNAVEIFINKYTEIVANSKGLKKTQVRYDAMVEAIPTFDGENESVELYEQHNFNNFDFDAIAEEIHGKLIEVKARCEAVKPAEKLECPVVFNATELSHMFMRIAFGLNYSAVYAKSNLFSKGDPIQKQPEGDLITLTIAGEVPGSARSSKFDADGITLGTAKLVENGVVVGYFGANSHGQYLGETPTGSMSCMQVAPGSIEKLEGPYLEILSTSGVQFDFYNDYIGGEVRLAYYHHDGVITPVTGVAIAGKLSEVLNRIRFTTALTTKNGYSGPAKALLTGLSIF